MRILRRIGLVLLLILVIAVIGFVAWAEMPPTPMPEALAALASDSAIVVNTEQWIEFTPSQGQPTTGFIFYPGGRVDERSYTPLLRAIAQAGYYAVIVPMPLNLAVFAPGRADAVIAAHPEITHWAIGGHSLGGAMAANYVYSQPSKVQGLVLWASYPAGNNSLVGEKQLLVTSIYGTNDGLAVVSDIEASKANLPPATTYVAIEGGNHGHFGWYGEQSGDGVATIERVEQQRQTVEATIALLQAIRE